MRKNMSRLLVFLLFLFLVGCVQEENELKKQMEEAEQYFDSILSKENPSAVYPNRLVLEKEAMAENWPAFFNAGKEEIEVKILTKCNKKFDISGSEGYFKIAPLEHKSFAIKLKATEQTGKGEAICGVQFFEKEKIIAENGFVAVVK